LQKAGFILASTDMLRRGKRYIVWFYLLNVVFARLSAGPFSGSVHGILDHSLYADRLLHGLDLGVLIELIARPEFGPVRSASGAGVTFALLFFLASLLFMPGVLLGFASDHRIPREEFFRACGRNVWRLLRLFVIFVLLAGMIMGLLFAVEGALANSVDASSNDDRLPLLVAGGNLGLGFVLLTALRIWFDLAQTDAVLRDQPAIRKSIRWGFRVTCRNFFRLLGSYLLAAMVATFILLAGISLWRALVPPDSVLGAFLVSQATLVLLLGSRFWQRALAVAFYLRHSTEREIEVSSDSLAAVPAP